jgi:hypothetical protein
MSDAAISHHTCHTVLDTVSPNRGIGFAELRLRVKPSMTTIRLEIASSSQ